ncbi:UNVERIFIED_CONTAM: zinc phosphodiesterase ELAC protein 2 [Trichonephila clavipes]
MFHRETRKEGKKIVLHIFAADVLDATSPAATVLIVDCPSEHFLDSFVNEEKFQIYQTPIENTCEITHVFHFSPDHIVKSKKYQAWISKFHQNVHHYILNSSNSSMSGAAIFQTQKLLHLIHPEVYRLLPKEKVELLPLHTSSKIMHPPPMLQIHLRPVQKLNCILI